MDGSQCLSSIDFNPQVLHDADVAECIREDQERERQVKERLDTMFDDMEMNDFEDGDEEEEEEEGEIQEQEVDEDGYPENNDPGVVDETERTVESFNDVNNSQNFEDEPLVDDGMRNWHLNQQWLMDQGTQQTSTPRGDGPPPALSTPSTVPHGYYSSQQMALFCQPIDADGVEPDYADPTDREENPQYWIQGRRDQQFEYDTQGDVVETDLNYHDQVTAGQQNMMVYHPGQFLGDYRQAFPMTYVTNGIYQNNQGLYHDGPYNLMNEMPAATASVGNFHLYPGVTATLPVSHNDYRSEVEATFTEGDLESPCNEAESTPPSRTVPKPGLRSPMKLPTLQTAIRDPVLDNYKVRFANPGLNVGRDGEDRGDGRETDVLEVTVPSGAESSPTDPQEKFLNQDGSRESHQVVQMQILNNAKDKRIKELTNELESVKDDLSRDIRILKHQLSLVTGERDGTQDSLQQSQQLLQQAMASKSQAEGEVAALQLQIASLKNDKDELTQKIISAESMIESLNSQLSESRSTDNWTRAKHQYETTIATLKHKHESEVLRIKQQLDDLTHQVEAKNEEVISLKKQLVDVTKASELAQIDRAETINRLTRSVHESQDQCNRLLASGVGQELSRLKLQLQDAIAGKSITEDMNGALQSELQELKEQVTMYESVSQFGILPGVSGSASGSRPGCFSPSFDPNDSYAQLGIKNPHPMRSESETSLTNEMLSGLKNELERCVKLYRDKRLQVAALQAELKSTKSNLVDVTTKLELASKSLQESETKLQETNECRPGQGIAEKRLERELEKVSREKNELVREVQELQDRLEEASLSEQQATDLCRDLSRQMSELVKEHDEDKRQAEANQKLALERCQATMLEHYERTKGEMRKQMMQESEQKMEKIRQDMEALEEELAETKQLYVGACEKTAQIEDEVNEKWQTVLKEQMEELKQQMISEKEEELEMLRSTLTSDAAAMTTESAKLLEEQQKRLEMEMEAKLLKAEEDWKRKQKEETENAVQSAEEMLKRQMEETFDLQLKEELAKAIEKCQADHHTKLQSELKARIEHARDEWRSTEMAEWKAKQLGLELEKVREAWRLEELAQELSRAKDEWTRTTLSKERRDWERTFLTKAIAEARDKWETVELSAVVEKAKNEVLEQAEIHSAQVRAALEQDWRERSEGVAKEHARQMAALKAKHEEELAKVLDAEEREWHQKLEAALKELELRAKAANEELLQLADEHNKAEIARHESTFQKRMTARQAEYQQHLTAVLQDNGNLQEQLHLAEMLAKQQEQQFTTDFEEAKNRWSNESEELRDKLEKAYENLQMSENERDELEKVAEILRETLEGAEEEKCKALRKKEEDFQSVVANYQRQMEHLGDKLGRAERVFKGLEAKTQKRLSSLQDSLEREHSAAIAQLEAKLIDQSHEHDLAMETVRRGHAAEVIILQEQLEMERRKNGEVEGLQAVQVEALQEMRNHYLQAIAKVKDEVFRHLEQTNRQNAEALRQKLTRERRRTARHLRKYYLRSFDQLLQRDFDSSFRAYALQAMENLLDNMLDRDSSPNSLFSSSSERTTPRDNVAPPSVGPASLQTNSASVAARPAAPSVTACQTSSGTNFAASDVGHFYSPGSNASSATSSTRKWPLGGVQADRGACRGLEASRVDCVTPTPENQFFTEAPQQKNLYFESSARKPTERFASTQFENDAVERREKEQLGSNREASNRNPEALNHNPEAMKRNERDFGLVGNTGPGIERYYETPNPSSRKDVTGAVVSSVTTERTAPPSGARTSQRFSEKNPAAEEMTLTASSSKPRSDTVFVTTRSPTIESFHCLATVAMGTTDNVTSRPAVVHDITKSLVRVGMATEPKKTNDESDEYVYTSLSQRLTSSSNTQKTGQISNLKSWSVSDLTRSSSHSVPKPPLSPAVSSSQMTTSVSHGLTAASSCRPLATSSLSHIPSLAGGDSPKVSAKSPFSHMNFSSSANNYKPAATFSLSHMAFTTPPVSHTSASNSVPPASFSFVQSALPFQDQTKDRKVSSSKGDLRDLENGFSLRIPAGESGTKKEAIDFASSNIGLSASTKPVIKPYSVQNLGRGSRN